MTMSSIQTGFVAGEISPSLFGRTDLAKWKQGASTMRNFLVNYRGGASSRAGTAYVGMCKQGAPNVGGGGSAYAPRDIPFQFSLSQGYALEFGDTTIAPAVTGAANNGAGLIRLAVASTRGLMTGLTMTVASVGGTTEANGSWVITVIDTTHVDLVGSAFVHNYTSGGTTSTIAGYMRIKSNGAYVIEATKAITGASKANPAVITAVAHGFAIGDWVYVAGIKGMTNLNGLTWVVKTVPSADTFTLTDLFGTVVDSSAWTAYSSGGTAARLYTLPTPYMAVDLPWLKYTQSADAMTLCCVNQTTLTEYPSYDLKRLGATNWTLTQISFGSLMTAPTNVAVTAHNSTTVSTWYGYVVTAVSQDTREESVASSAATVENNDIAVYAGTNTVTWNAVANAGSYNVFKATPSYGAAVPVGVLYGFAGSALGPTFTDTNITADFTIVPPMHTDPFARKGITAVTVATAGNTCTQATSGYSVTTSTGSGFVGQTVIVGGALAGFIVYNPGSGYANGDSITITDSNMGAVVGTVTLTIGKSSGTYPGVVSYFQQRRVFANSLNNPDTYWMSQPGAYANYDTATPVADSDSITGTPWATQVNGIQFLQAMPGGLVVLTGKGAWQVNGGTSSAITPADETASPQAYNGCSAVVPPIAINYDILYVQSKGSVVRDLAYNFFVNIYTGTDTTVLSNHLFADRTILQWAYAEEPYKVVWLVRDDGTMLSLTFLKEQDVYGWARHDTDGLFVGVCSITEPPVDAVYAIVQRYIKGVWVYYAERMDNRLWNNVESSWCVDAGLTYPQTYPAAVLTPGQAAVGTGVTFTASASVFTAGNVGDVIRVGGGKATITAYTSGTQVTATITQAITAVLANDPVSTPIPQAAGTWSTSTPTTTVSGLNHLEGKTVAILADGSVVTSQVVSGGAITLPQSYSAITVGLPYTCQLQSLYLDPPNQPVTAQGKRKNLYAVTVRVEASRGIQIGANQIDASTQPYGASPAWTQATGMREVKERNAKINAGVAIPLFTGDLRELVPADWNVKGQIAVQQPYPMPANILAIIPEWQLGDSPG